MPKASKLLAGAAGLAQAPRPHSQSFAVSPHLTQRSLPINFPLLQWERPWTRPPSHSMQAKPLSFPVYWSLAPLVLDDLDKGLSAVSNHGAVRPVLRRPFHLPVEGRKAIACVSGRSLACLASDFLIPYTW